MVAISINMIMAYFERRGLRTAKPLFKLCIIRTFSKDIVWFGVKCFKSEETLARVRRKWNILFYWRELQGAVTQRPISA